MRRSFVLLTLVVAMASCAGPSARRPLTAIDAYVQALEVGDYDKAYEMMSEAYKRAHTKDEFVRMMKESPADVRDTARRLKGGKRQVAVKASYVYDDLEDELLLVEEGGEWRIASDPLDFYPQETPRACLRSFLRAVELGRWDVLVRFVPKEYAMTEVQIRAQFEGDQKQEVADLVAKLRGAIDNPIQIEGDQARMLYGDRSEVVFKKEDGVWKIEDFK